MSKIGKLKQRLAMMFDLAGTKAPVTRNKWIDDDIVMANPEKYGIEKPTRTKPFKWNPPRDPEHEAWVKEQYDNFDKFVGDLKTHNEDVKTEKESYESSVIRKPKKHRPKKPTQQDRIDVMEARLKQRIAQVRLAATFGKGQSFYVSQEVIDSFKSRKPFRMNQKIPGRKKQYSFQTDGNTLFQLTPDVPQKRYEIASWDDEGNLNWSFENHDSASTIQAGKMLGIDIERKGGQMFVNGKYMDHTTIGKPRKIPKEELQSGFVSKGKGRKPMTPEQYEKQKAQTSYRHKSRTYWKKQKGVLGEQITDPETGEIYDQASIQPHQQRQINKTLGFPEGHDVGTVTPATQFHHGIPAKTLEKMGIPRDSPGAIRGSTPVSHKSHMEAEHPESTIPKAFYRNLKKARLKIARIRMAAAPGISMNPQHGRTIADAFDTMQHTPNSPKVKASYNAFINETNDQARALQKKGIKFESLRKRQPYGKKGGIQGYDSYKDMHSDIEKNKHLFYRMSDNDYKGFEDNPMFKMTDIRNSEGHRMRANDVFRAVHDINGHNLAGRSAFTPSGEHKAFLQHRKMYSPLASKALFTETAGQGNWTNYSKKHGAKNRYFQKINKIGNLKFPQQKAGLLPDDIIGGNWHQRQGKQRNIRAKTSIRTMQAKADIKLRYPDNMRNYKNLVATPEGRQWIVDNQDGWYIGKDGTPRNVVNNPRDAQKSLDETPGEGDLYVVANTKDVRDPHSKEISDGFERWEKEMPEADVSIGGYTDKLGKMEYDSSAAFRSDSPQKAMEFAKKYKQESYMVISNNDAKVTFYNPDGSVYT